MSDVNDWLKERRKIHDAATEGPWETSQNEDQESTTYLESDREEILVHDERGHGHMREEYAWMRRVDAQAIVDAHNTLPALLTAVEKTLGLHRPDTVFAWSEDCTDPDSHHAFTDVRSGDMLCEDEPLGQFCAGCVPENDTTIDLTEYSWPCDTYRAIEAALTRQEPRP